MGVFYSDSSRICLEVSEERWRLIMFLSFISKDRKTYQRVLWKGRVKTLKIKQQNRTRINRLEIVEENGRWTGNFFTDTNLRKFFHLFLLTFYCLGSVSSCWNVVYHALLYFCVIDSIIFILGGRKGKCKESRRNTLSAHFQWEVFIPALIWDPISVDKFTEVDGDLLLLLSHVYNREKNFSCLKFLSPLESRAKEKRQSCQGRTPLLQGALPFFSFWDVIAQIWNSIMHMQLNDLKMLQFQIVLIPRKV